MAGLNSSMQPSSMEYGGDEVSAIVLDPGYWSTRAGFAGEDVPKSAIPSHYGYQKEAGESSEAQFHFGDNSIYTPQSGLEIRNPMSKEGVVEDWDAATKLWEYTITSRLTNSKPSNPKTNGLNDPANGDEDASMDDVEEAEKPLEDSPLLMTEPSWNSVKAREKSLQVAMEDFGCPAFWLSRTAVNTAFSFGKPSALVIDVGASSISVTPVHDGLILKKAAFRCPLGGNFVSQQARLFFAASQPPIPITPHYLVTSKTPVEAGAPASATYREFSIPPHESFRRLQEERILTEFKESVVQVFPQKLASGPQGAIHEDAKNAPGRPFEMPDGWNQVFGADRFKIVEGVFDPKMAYTDPDHPAPQQNQTLPAVIKESVNNVDIEIRGLLLSNVVITGGSSLLYQFTDRVHWELQQMFPSFKIRVQAPGNTQERRFASWIGGSILASLGTFHQMWISKKEYDEHGPNIIEKRCK